MLGQVNRLEKLDFDDLPNDSEDDVRVLATLDQVGRVYVCDLATNRLGCIDAEVLVLANLVNIELALLNVERALVHSTRHSLVDELAKKDFAIG